MGKYRLAGPIFGDSRTSISEGNSDGSILTCVDEIACSKFFNSGPKGSFPLLQRKAVPLTTRRSNFRHRNSKDRGESPPLAGGKGGDAEVAGDHSTARGGDAGDAVIGPGGDGGTAKVNGTRSSAVGGRGGRGGIGPGGSGMHVEVDGDNQHARGGDGGEANQPDGRGGRGGASPISDEHREMFGLPKRRPHMRWPYGEPITEPGRGGDGADTPQYKARRLIIEDLKASYFRANGLSALDVWWDRETVPLGWLNEQLQAGGFGWRAAIVADEYEFTDVR